MKDIHVSDLDIQKYAFEREECEPQIVKHLQSCQICKERAQAYLSLSSFIKEEPEPELDYDLSSLVLDQLPARKAVDNNYNYLIYFIVLIITGLGILTLFLFRETITYLLDSTLVYQNYFLMNIILLISLVQVLDLFRAFNQRMNILNS